jgi:hypothetical protein
MTVDKRRLGRGLEVLLTDSQASPETGNGAFPASGNAENLSEALTMIRHLRFENRRLLAELEVLNALLREADDLIRRSLN